MTRSERFRGDAGVTVVEMTVASAILIAALAGMLSVLVSFQRTTSFETSRNRALDDLRITAGTFSKDVRHAAGISAFNPVSGGPGGDRIELQTYVNGTIQTVTYRLVADVADPTKWNLQRQAAGGTRIFVIKLTDRSVFTPTPAYDTSNTTESLESIRRVQLHMETKPLASYPAVALATEVSLRNVTD